MASWRSCKAPLPGPSFPACRPTSSASGGNGTKVLGRWVRSLGIVDLRLAPNHSWRHRLKTSGRRYGLAPDIIDAITGHAHRSVGVAGRLTAMCRATAPGALLPDLTRFFRASGITAAIARHDTATLFDWLARVLAFQGVSNATAAAYLDQHGTVGFDEIAAALAAGPSCPKLKSFWHFHDCRFAKVAGSCAEPDHIAVCPLPRHDLRNGRLIQAAYSLFFFLRDICGGDLVGWLDDRLASAAAVGGGDGHCGPRLCHAVLDPLTGVFGVSAKVVSLALSDLLLGGDPGRPLWVEAGAGVVVVDTLVHAWLHRTGCLRDLGAEHAYGPGCYAPGGCAAIIAAAAERIDARTFCPDGPVVFPRLVQRAVWLFCAMGEHDTCNGNRIDDRHACQHRDCPIVDCARVALRPAGDSNDRTHS